MKIGALSSVSGVSRSTIHHYLNMGLLPEPVRTGLNLCMYDEVHLARLLAIKRLRETQKLPLQAIKALLAKEGDTEKDIDPEQSRHGQPPSVQINLETPGRQVTRSKRQQIMDTATELFCQKGFEAVRISDIADALQMGKATLYEYFQTKEELFIECIERLSLIVLPREIWEEINQETDIFQRLEKRARSFLEAFKDYGGILNLARTASHKKDTKIAEKGRAAIRLMTLPMRDDLEKAQKEGTIRRIDPELVSYFLLSLGESLGSRIEMDDKYSTEKGLQVLMNFIRKALEH